MSAILRGLRRLAAGLGFVVLLVAAVVTGLLWLTLPPRSQQVRIPGLTGPVDIGFDQDGVPRIRAANANDAAAALGFVHARDRLFQMEMMRRAASGRL
jgi:penicillin G amidase